MPTKLPHTLNSMKTKHFYDTHKSGLDYVLTKRRQRHQDKMSASLVGLRQVIERTMIDLNAHMDACISIIRQLETESIEKDPELLENIKLQVDILKEDLLDQHGSNVRDTEAIVSHYDYRVKLLISQAKDYNQAALERFVSGMHKALKTCEELLKQADEARSVGLENEDMLKGYVVKIKSGLSEQISKVEKHRPLLYPSVPSLKPHINGDTVNKENYIKCLDHMIDELDKRLEYLREKRVELAKEKVPKTLKFTEHKVHRSSEESLSGQQQQTRSARKFIELRREVPRKRSVGPGSSKHF